MVEVVDGNLCTAALVFLPVIDFLGAMDVGKAEILIEARHIGLINANNGKPSGTYALADKVGEDTVASL